MMGYGEAGALPRARLYLLPTAGGCCGVFVAGYRAPAILTHANMHNPGLLLTGLIPRICQGIFDRADKIKEKNPGTTFVAEVGYLEIYNEKVRVFLSVHNVLKPCIQFQKKSNQHAWLRFGGLRCATAESNMVQHKM